MSATWFPPPSKNAAVMQIPQSASLLPRSSFSAESGLGLNLEFDVHELMIHSQACRK